MSVSSYKIENITFEIIIEKEDNYFYGKWKCQCGETGDSSKACDDEQSATLATKTNAATHYGALHR